MTETVIPATYVEVRAEGLSSAGGIATGVVGVVGTAAGGPLGVPVALGGLVAARELFGAPDQFDRPLGETPLTLVRALELAYGNGASSVVAVRVAGPARSAAGFAVKNEAGAVVATLTARHPGTDGNSIHVLVLDADEPGIIENEEHTATFLNLRHRRVRPSPANRIRVVRGESKRVDILQIVYRDVVDGEWVVPDAAGRYRLARPVVTPAESPSVNTVNVITVRAPDNTVTTYADGDIIYGGGAAPDPGDVRLNDRELIFGQQPPPGSRVEATYAVQALPPAEGEVRLSVWDGALDFASDGPVADNGDRLLASYQVAAADCVEVRLERAGVAESYTVPSGEVLVERVNASSNLATAAGNGREKPAEGVDGYFGTGASPAGANGEDAGPDDYRTGLEALAGQTVDIVVLAGQDTATMGALLLGHLEATEQTDRERIGVIGAPGSTVADFLGHTVADDRVVVTAPGLRQPDGVVLPPGYTAAAVAGLLGSVPVQASLTNKPLAVPGLAVDVNRTEQAQLIRRDVLTIVDRQGFRVVKGVTSAGTGTPFSAIPTRRIVDFAKYGVRSAANPYIGRLNNDRVRSALKASLDAFLTGMVADEALVSYKLDVSATRAQEIAGEVAVTMTIQPTFSIEYVRVTMILR